MAVRSANALDTLKRFFSPHRADSRILVTFLALVAGLLAFGHLASEIAEGDTFAMDKAIVTGLRTAADPGVPIGPHWLQGWMIDFTALGGAPVLTLITVVVVGLLASLQKFRMAGFVAVAIAGGALLSVAIKAIFDRARPEIVPHLVEVTSASFPSGHAMNSSIVYLTLAVLLARSQESRRVQIYLITVAIALALLIGCTRVYLGVHWPTDVLAGWSVGAAFSAACSLVAKRLQREHTIEQAHETTEDARGEDTSPL
ncbi:phosphatase PAP2 family protein [Aurantiacibacter zhengii]|uniref:PAP2 family protein n=1 Tax=Aurantiacibacter zhengii TaxID=2307003 RepID=A0A418NWK5_9SPHN|nr:phosphatase PAP2 family protein [Aurantiacibacter zhengii]RIV89007.1 PAP2 family protein [Aurantiacibacter zhengii]